MCVVEGMYGCPYLYVMNGLLSVTSCVGGRERETGRHFTAGYKAVSKRCVRPGCVLASSLVYSAQERVGMWLPLFLGDGSGAAVKEILRWVLPVECV